MEVGRPGPDALVGAGTVAVPMVVERCTVAAVPVTIEVSREGGPGFAPALSGVVAASSSEEVSLAGAGALAADDPAGPEGPMVVAGAIVVDGPSAEFEAASSSVEASLGAAGAPGADIPAEAGGATPVDGARAADDGTAVEGPSLEAEAPLSEDVSLAVSIGNAALGGVGPKPT